MSSPELRRIKNNGEAMHNRRMGLRIRAIIRNHVDTVIKVTMIVDVIDHGDIPFTHQRKGQQDEHFSKFDR